VTPSGPSPIASFTYTPPVGFTGLDSFTYDTCDPYGECDTITVRVAVGEETYFLGSSGTAKVDVLPFLADVTAEHDEGDAAFDYDTDTDPGLTIKDGNALADEPDPLKRQWWDLPTAGVPHQLSGDVNLTLWSQQDNGDNAQDGQVRAFLLDCALTDGTDCHEVALADTTLLAPWSTEQGFVRFDLDFGRVVHTVDPGRTFRLMVAVDKGHNGKMWFAFDDVDYPAVLAISLDGGPTAYGDVLSADELTPTGFTAADLSGNDIDPAAGGLTVTPAGVSANGGTIAGSGPFTFTPAPGFYGLDSFTYDVCDIDAACDTGTVRVAVGEYVGWLGSNGVVPQNTLPLSGAGPTKTLLADYDSDLLDGLTVDAGGGLATEPDPDKRQWWDETAPAGGIELSGPVEAVLWTAQDLYDTIDQGIVNVHVLECAVGETDPTLCTQIASAGRDATPWQTTAEFVSHVYDFGEVYHTVPAGRALRVVAAVDDAKNGRMWFAFDTVEYPSVLIGSFNGSPVAHDDPFETGQDTPLVINDGDVLGNDTDPDLDALHVGRVDAASAAGGTVTPSGPSPIASFTYTPPNGYSGLDTFTYDACDDYDRCNPATVHVAVGHDVFFLGSFGVTRQSVLPLTGTVPNAGTLPNYDTVDNVDPGLTIYAGNALADETDPKKRQWWDKPTAAAAYQIAGEVDLVFWTAQDDFVNSDTGDVHAYLLDCALSDGTDCQEVAFAELVATPWQAGTGFARHDAAFGYVSHTVDPGRVFRAMLAVDDAHNGRMWFAFDTADHPSVLTIGRTGGPVAYADVITSGELGPTAFTAGDLSGNDVDPAAGGLTVTPAGVSANGGTITGSGPFTYAPPAGFSGLDSFTYDVCDVNPVCATGTVRVAVGEYVGWLGSNGVVRQNVLPLSPGEPTKTLLADYDNDMRDGLTLAAGGGLATETDPTKRQWWDQTATGSGIELSGNAKVTLWTTQDVYDTVDQGIVNVHLLDCAVGETDPTLCTAIASAGRDATPWQSTAEFTVHVYDFGDVTYTVPAGRALRVVAAVDDAKNGRMWLAFDTVDHPSVLTVSFNAAPVTLSDVFTGGNHAPIVITDAQLLANDTEPDGDPMAVDRVDATTVAGGTITDGGGTYTYAPPTTLWAGIDSFTYDNCDTFSRCTTETVTLLVGDSQAYYGSGLLAIGGNDYTWDGSQTLPVNRSNVGDPAFDYDTDGDPGLTIKKWNALNKTPEMTHFFEIDVPSGFVFDGSSVLATYLGMKDFNNGSLGQLEVQIRDCDSGGGGCSTVTTQTLTADPWGSSGDFVLQQFDLGALSHEVLPGRMVEVRMRVIETGGGEMWFATDTVDYPSALLSGYNRAPMAVADVFSTANDTSLVIDVAADLTANDSDPDADALSFDRVDAVSAAGGTITDGGSSLTYTPSSASYTGLDSFTYDVCDPFGACGTATVSVAVGETVAFFDSAASLPDSYVASATAPSISLADDDPAFDYDGDGKTGDTVREGIGTSAEPDPTRRIYWDVPASGSDIVLSGEASVTVWTELKSGDNTRQGIVQVHLVDCDGSGAGCTDIATAELDLNPWWPTDFVYAPHTFELSDVYHTVTDGRRLRIILTTTESNGELYAGFATVDYPSVLTVGSNGTPVGAVDFITTPVDTPLVVPDATLLGNDADPDGDVISIGRADAATTAGGSVSDGAGDLTYTPPAGLTGLDSFTYDVCDPLGACDTVQVWVTVGDQAGFLSSTPASLASLQITGAPVADLDVDDPAFDYDTDSNPGLTVRDGDGLSGESDATRRIWWDLPSGGAPLELSGDTVVTLWSAQQDYKNASQGIVNAYLMQCGPGDTDGSTCAEIAGAGLDLTPWATVPEFVPQVFDFGPVSYTIPAGDILRIVVVVDKADGGKMWFGYDTVSMPSVVTLGLL
jgi:hypothetical protein